MRVLLVALLLWGAAAARLANEPPCERRRLTSFLGKYFSGSKLQADFDKAHLMVEQALDAAYANGDSDEVDAQMDVFEDLEDLAARVREAAEAVQVYESAAQQAVDETSSEIVLDASMQQVPL